MSTIKAVVILSLLVSSAVAQESSHKFFDKTNAVLFTAHAAATAWDAFVTKRETSPHFLISGGCVPNSSALHNCPYSYGYPEGNPVARPFVKQGTPGVVTFFALEVVGSVAGAYLLHRTGHHKLERALSVVDIGFSVHGAASWTGRR